MTNFLGPVIFTSMNTSFHALLDRAESSIQRRLIRDLTDMAKERAYQPGKALPPERVLSQRFSVSRPTLRAALKHMEHAGMVQPLGPKRRTFSFDPDDFEHDAVPSLNTGSLMTDTIVVLAKSPGNDTPSSSEEAITAGALNYLRSQNLHVFVISPKLLDNGKERSLLAQPPMALIAKRDSLSERIEQTLIARLIKAKIPIVVYGQPEDNPDFNVVGSDHFEGARLLVHHLASLGRRRILPTWAFDNPEGETRPWLLRREAGYRHACEELGLEPLEPVRFVLPNYHARVEPEEFANRIRIAAGFLYEHLHGDNPPDALMAPSDGPAMIVAAACRLLGFDPSRDLNVVGYDNNFSDSLERKHTDEIPTATIDKNNANAGTQLAKLALEVAQSSDDAAQPIHRLTPPQLVITQKNGTPSND